MARDDDALLKELRAIKLLMVMQLLRQGARQNQIAAALGVSERTLGRMMPAGMPKRGATAVDGAGADG